jgi:hypothetical protein
MRLGEVPRLSTVYFAARQRTIRPETVAGSLADVAFGRLKLADWFGSGTARQAA